MKISRYIFATTHDEVLEKLENESLKFYLGVDPTSDSLHIGHLSILVFAKKLIAKNHNFFIVLGGLTAMIGDPSGKNKERTLLPQKTLNENIKKLTKWLDEFFQHKVDILNNFDWLKIDLLTFLRDYGKLFNLNTMISKDQIATRLDKGISFTETSYQILQSMDFAHLFKSKDISLQIGGQDQWGNIVSGLELIKKLHTNKRKAYGVTLPLLTKANGTKFGKTESGNIWLDESKTTPYELYQFLYNTPDGEVANLTKFLTFVNEDELRELRKDLKINPQNRQMHKYLAKNVVLLVHKEKGLNQALKVTKALFENDFSTLNEEDFMSVSKAVVSEVIKEDNINIQDLLVLLKVSDSRKRARYLIENKSISLNGKLITDFDYIVKKNDGFFNKFQIIKKGKRNYSLGKH